MNLSFLFLACFAFVLSQRQAVAQTCIVQPIFPTNLPNPNPLICDGDAGGSQISVFSNSVSFRLLGGSPEPILGFPDKEIPNRLDLVIARRSDGQIDRASSFVRLNSDIFTYRNAGDERRMFRTYFNILQVFVAQFETGNCPIDNKGQVYPELASVRGGMLSLASLFGVTDCSGGNV